MTMPFSLGSCPSLSHLSPWLPQGALCIPKLSGMKARLGLLDEQVLSVLQVLRAKVHSPRGRQEANLVSLYSLLHKKLGNQRTLPLCNTCDSQLC